MELTAFTQHRGKKRKKIKKSKQNGVCQDQRSEATNREISECECSHQCRVMEQDSKLVKFSVEGKRTG